MSYEEIDLIIEKLNSIGSTFELVKECRKLVGTQTISPLWSKDFMIGIVNDVLRSRIED